MAQTSLRTLALRWGIGGFACSAALVAVGVGFAQGISGFNSDAPVNYAADRIELQDKQQRVVLSGNVDISQGDLRLRAGRTTVAYTDAGALKIQRLDATGGVVVTRGNETARGEVAIYDFNRRIITLAGGVSLLRGSDSLPARHWHASRMQASRSRASAATTCSGTRRSLASRASAPSAGRTRPS